ncbi:ATP-binding cassette domain-containing protein [Spirochaeta dissipatitropha]
MNNTVVQDISLRYGKTEAIKGLSCTLSTGVTYGLIGRNGAGKTSLLSLLASYRKPDSGSIQIRGESLFENTDRMGDVHFVYSRDMSEEDDSVLRNLQHSARYRPDFDMEYALELMNRFRLDPDKAVNQLSVGMQAAVNVIEGLASRAPLTLFDEVHHGMDAPSRELFYEAVIESRAAGDRCFVLSTHLVSEMDYLFDHVLIMDKGSLLIDEPYDDVVARGITVTGEIAAVDRFCENHQVISRKTLGGTAAAMLYGLLTEKEQEAAVTQGLELSPVSLQELFIHLSKEENNHAINQH